MKNDDLIQQNAVPNLYYRIKCRLGFHRFRRVGYAYRTKAMSESFDDLKCERCGVNSPATRVPISIDVETRPSQIAEDSVPEKPPKCSARFFGEPLLERCVELGRQLGTEPQTHRMIYCETEPCHIHYFLGVQPQSAAVQNTYGGLVVLRVKRRADVPASNNPFDWQMEYVWALRLKGDAGDWQKMIMQKHEDFKLSSILLNPTTCGQFIIGRIRDAKYQGSASIHNLLRIYTRGEAGIERLWPMMRSDANLVDNANVAFLYAMEEGKISFPLWFNERPKETRDFWNEETAWSQKILDQCLQQLNHIEALTKPDGTWALTLHSARQFTAVGSHELADAAIYAYVSFLLWLKGRTE